MIFRGEKSVNTSGEECTTKMCRMYMYIEGDLKDLGDFFPHISGGFHSVSSSLLISVYVSFVVLQTIYNAGSS